MHGNKKILGVVPARGGSKGIPKKNLKKINNQSLIELVARFCAASKVFDAVICSTDDPDITLEANRYGMKTPFTRSSYLSKDETGDLPVLKNAILEFDDHESFDIVVLLQPTAPIRFPLDLINGLDLLIEKKVQAVWSVQEIDSKYHPKKILNIKDNFLFLDNPEGSKIIARQQLPQIFIRTGAFYIYDKLSIMKSKTWYLKRTLPVIIERANPSIDTLEDLYAAEQLFLKERPY